MIMGYQTIRHAQELLAGTHTEVENRAAASRAYMGAFQHVLENPLTEAFEPQRTGQDHRRILEFLRNRGDSLGPNLAGRLTRIRRLRNFADYDTREDFSRALAEDAVEMAAEIAFDWLATDND